MSDVSPRRFSDVSVKLLFATITTGCAAIAIATPRPVEPTELPFLPIDPRAMDRAIESHQTLAREAPTGELVERLEIEYADFNRLELGLPTSRRNPSSLSADLRETINAIETAHGPTKVAALRARFTNRAMNALVGKTDDEHRREILGKFGAVLRRYRAVDGDIRVAPMLVIRALFQGRWNGIMGRPLTEGMTPLELQAYWGWLVFGATDAPIDLRIGALERFRSAGGSAGPEVEAALRLEAGENAGAAALFNTAYETTQVLRFRNHALFAQRE